MGILFAFLTVGMAGCVSEDAPEASIDGSPSGAIRGDGEFWLILVSGDESQVPASTRACSVLWTHTVDEGTKTIRYSQDMLAGNQVGPAPVALISAVVWDASGCPISNQITDAGRVEVVMNALGSVPVTALDDGRVLVGEQVIRPGQSITLSGQTLAQDGDFRTVRFTDELVVRAVGPWPLSALLPEA